MSDEGSPVLQASILGIRVHRSRSSPTGAGRCGTGVSGCRQSCRRRSQRGHRSTVLELGLLHEVAIRPAPVVMGEDPRSSASWKSMTACGATRRCASRRTGHPSRVRSEAMSIESRPSSGAVIRTGRRTGVAGWRSDRGRRGERSGHRRPIPRVARLASIRTARVRWR
jgi:hypothetical protein